jgi:hypothetical protein
VGTCWCDTNRQQKWQQKATSQNSACCGAAVHNHPTFVRPSFDKLPVNSTDGCQQEKEQLPEGNTVAPILTLLDYN